MQYKEGRREDRHKFLGVNNDMDITHPIWSLVLNSSLLSQQSLPMIIFHFIISSLKGIFDHTRIFLIRKNYVYLRQQKKELHGKPRPKHAQEVMICVIRDIRA